MALDPGMTAKAKTDHDGRPILSKLAAAGFKNVMLDQDGGRNLDRWISMAQNYGFHVPYVHLDSKQASSIWSENNKRADFIKHIRRSIEICGRHRVSTVILHPAHYTTKKKDDEIALESFEQILKSATEYDVRVALENVDLHFLAYLETLLDHHKNNPNVGFCFDSGHWNLETAHLDLLGRYGDKLLAVHLHDNLGQMEFVPTFDDMGNLVPPASDATPARPWDLDLHLLPFDGNVDFHRVAEGIAKTKRKQTTTGRWS